jgi:alkanesulfonate monooxygenase SsuD/methylene tetrahydromethanopterin reductase-like flavin-dependent oxidoreductase (luciferase family)
MKFGVATFFTGQGIGPAALAQALEERGFDSLFVTEHTHIPASRRTPYPAGGELPEGTTGCSTPSWR